MVEGVCYHLGDMGLILRGDQRWTEICLFSRIYFFQGIRQFSFLFVASSLDTRNKGLLDMTLTLGRRKGTLPHKE